MLKDEFRPLYTIEFYFDIRAFQHDFDLFSIDVCFLAFSQKNTATQRIFLLFISVMIFSIEVINSFGIYSEFNLKLQFLVFTFGSRANIFFRFISGSFECAALVA